MNGQWKKVGNGAGNGRGNGLELACGPDGGCSVTGGVVYRGHV